MTSYMILTSVVLVVAYRTSAAGTVEVREGLNEILSCVSEEDVNSLRWMKDGKPITQGEQILRNNRNKYRILSSYGEYNLQVFVATHHDSGTYVCLGTRGAIKEITLYVKYSPRFSQVPANQTAEEESSVSLECVATGYPKPHITWYRRMLEDSKPVDIDTGISGEWLALNNVTRFASGQYVCSASNSQGTANHTIHVDVRFAPTVKVLDTNVSVEGHESVALICAIQSNPHLDDTAVWHFRGRQLTDSSTYLYQYGMETMDRYRTFFIWLKFNTFQLNQEHFEDDAFSCRASNSVGMSDDVRATLRRH